MAVVVGRSSGGGIWVMVGVVIWLGSVVGSRGRFGSRDSGIGIGKGSGIGNGKGRARGRDRGS